MAKKDDLTIFLRAQDKTKKAFASATKNMEELKKLGATLGKSLGVVTAAVGAVGAALFQTFNSNAPYIDALAKTADKLGVTTEKLLAYRDAADFAGIKQTSLDTGLQRFIRRLAEANQGSKGLVQGLQDLGLNAQELTEMGPEKAFEAMLGALEKVPTASERVRLAFKFFDTEGVDLVRLTTDAITESANEMDRLGLSISRIDAARVEIARDAIKRLGDVTQGVGRRITVGISGAVTVLTNRLTNAIANFLALNKSGRNASEIILKAFGKVIDVFRLMRTQIDFVRIMINRMSIAFLGFGETVASAIDEKVLGSMAKLPGPMGDFADSLLDAGGATGQLTEKIKTLELANQSLLDGINNRFARGSAVDELLSELNDVNAQADQVGASVGNLGGLTGGGIGEVPGVAGASSANDDLVKMTENYKVTREQLKLFTVDTDAAKANTAAFQSVLQSAGSALGSLGDAFAKNKKQARAFVAVQEILAVVSAYSAASQALADVTNPTPFQKFAAYASVLARGLAAVAAIKRAGSSIGSAGGGASSSAAAAEASSSSTATNATQQAANQTQTNTGPNVTIQLSGRGRFESEMVEDLVSEMQRLGVLRNNVNIAA